MSGRPPEVHAIGEDRRVAGLGLAGAVVHLADDAAAAVRAWDALLGDPPGLILLTPAAAVALRSRLVERPGALVCVLPETAG